MTSKIETSLLGFLKCGVCLEQKEQQKVLPCQHRICVLCAKQLPVRNKRFKCPVCTKEHAVPSTGMDDLPDCDSLKKIANIVKSNTTEAAEPDMSKGDRSTTEKSISEEQKETALSKIATEISTGGFGFVPCALTSETEKSSATQQQASTQPKGKKGKKKGTKQLSTAEDQMAELGNLRDQLRAEAEAGSKKLSNADDLMQFYQIEKANLKANIQKRKDEITAFRSRITKLCNDKLAGLSKLSNDRHSELEQFLREVKPKSDKLRNSLQSVPHLSTKLLAADCTKIIVEDSQKCLNTLKSINSEKTFDEGSKEKEGTRESGKSVRLDYTVDLGDDVEEFVKGDINHASVGVFRGCLIERRPHPFSGIMHIETKKALICFPGKADWEGPLDHSSNAMNSANLPVEGDTVKIKATVKEPHTGRWRDVIRNKSRGVLKEIENAGPKNNLNVSVDFPECHGWKGLYSELQLVQGCGFEVGDKVWVNRSIPEPSRGWAGVNGSSVGTVRQIDGDSKEAEVTVEFPECSEWVGLSSELEFVREAFTGEKVQVKLSVTEPKLGWGGIKHDDVGTLRDIIDDEGMGTIGQVWFANRRKKWSCKLDELEPARYQAPDYGPQESEGIDAMVLMNMMRYGALDF